MESVDPGVAAELLGEGVTAQHVRARLRRGSLVGHREADGTWRIAVSSITEAINDAGLCGGCDDPATEYVIVKYHHHERVEFSLCAQHGRETTLSYRRQGGVLEVVSYPLQSEGWLRPE